MYFFEKCYVFTDYQSSSKIILVFLDIIINQDIFIFFLHYNIKFNRVLNEDTLKKFVYLNLTKLNSSKNNKKLHKMTNPSK